MWAFYVNFLSDVETQGPMASTPLILVAISRSFHSGLLLIHHFLLTSKVKAKVDDDDNVGFRS